MTHEYRILIGTNGWAHQAWETGFYPEDLPEEWQLGFYSNEFPVVMLDAAAWSNCRADIEEWLDDCNESLQLVCEVPKDVLELSSNEAIQLIQSHIDELTILQSHLLAVIIPVRQTSAELESILSSIKCPVAVCLELDVEADIETTTAIRALCQKQGLSLVWHGEENVSGLTSGSVAISRINTQGMDLRQLRHVVETMLKETTLEQTSVLIIDGEIPDIEMVRNANVILDLF